ncbi:MAG: protein translocase subunit SecD [Deltaproteobacteria bacterium]|nr:protein translocase subunit SecD [Deltaproteobacteria bacterium]
MLQNILQYGLLGLALVCAVGGYLSKVRRNSLWIAAVAGGSAAAAAHYDSFWVMVIFALIMLWSAITAARYIDLAWRVKLGMVIATGLLCILSLWPTAHRLSSGKVPCPQYIKDNVGFQMVAGLDLRGGLRLVYTVDVEEAIRDKRDRYYDEMRQMLTTSFGFHSGDKPPTRDELAKLNDKIEMDKPRAKADLINLVFKDASDASKLDERFNKRFQWEMTTLRQQDGKTFNFRIRTEVESQIRERAVTQAKETILRRVDELGLREASVTVRDEDIIIEVPGEDEKTFKEIREIISKTARLEFKMLDDDTDFIGTAVKKLGPKPELPAGIRLEAQTQSVGPGKTNQIHAAVIEKQSNETMQQALDRLKAWVETLGVPSDREVGYGVVRSTDPDTLVQKETGWQTYYLFSRADVTGDQIRDASAQADQGSQSLGGWHVALTFTDSGGERFEEITGANIKRRFAIILDGKTESAPVIQSKIAGGHAQITMGASDPQTQLEESRKLELVLRSGALPAPITPSNEQRIGPSLGLDSIKQGVKAAAIGSAVVLIFMVIYYHRAGFIADIAVLFNLLMQMAVLAGFGASMTLPGIAGLALTIGMAVDANVLINERIREELRAGKSVRAAVDAGYDRAFAAIFDGHVTTLLSGLVLAQYGSGPIKGFAVTLVVGIVASLFTTVFSTRVIFDWWARGLKAKTLSMG